MIKFYIKIHHLVESTRINPVFISPGVYTREYDSSVIDCNGRTLEQIYESVQNMLRTTITKNNGRK